MKPTKQENPLGCSIACVAFILGINYQNSLNIFNDGKKKADKLGFLCGKPIYVIYAT